MATPSPYEAQILASRINHLALDTRQMASLDRLMRASHRELTAAIDRAAGAGNVIQANRLTGLQQQVFAIMNGTIDDVRDGVVKDMTIAARFAKDGRLKASIVHLTPLRPDLVNQIPRAFATVPRDAVQAILSRTFDNGKTFSTRIWDMRRSSVNAVSNTVTKGVIQGKSAIDIAKELEAYLVMTPQQERAFARVWAEKHTPAWKADWKTRGQLKSNAKRLARTEINNSFREAAIYSGQRSPWVIGQKWNLSASHPRPDICDVWATADSGLGAGVYHFNDTPVGHPRCLCFLTDELVSLSDLETLLLAA